LFFRMARALPLYGQNVGMLFELPDFDKNWK
jgi:hypothetical protein